MPNLDRTGPQGEGPMTGRRIGFLRDNLAMQPRMGRRQGYGYGYGYGCCRRFQVWPFQEMPTDVEELEILKEEQQTLNSALKNVSKRITELEKNKSQDD